MIKPASRSTLHDNILSQLIVGIREGLWKPGDKLPGEQELAKQFQVSRNCIREVLKALGLSGIIEARVGQGTFLTKDALSRLEGGELTATVLGDASIWELVEVRAMLEGQVAFLAAKRATEDNIALLQKALQQRDPNESYKSSDFRFHAILSTMAGNSLLTSFSATVQSRMNELRKRYIKMPGKIVRTFDQEHADIYNMIKERRPEEAREAMIRHIDNAWVDALYAELQEADSKE